MSRMRGDAVKEIVASDPLLKYEGSMQMCGIGRREDRKQDDIYRVSQSVRHLGRVLQHARESHPDITLYDLLVPDKFDTVVGIGRQMSTEKIGKQRLLALQRGQSQYIRTVSGDRPYSCWTQM